VGAGSPSVADSAGSAAHASSADDLRDYDDAKLIVARGKYCFVVLNLFPYNSGHAMVCPYRHIPYYTDLTPPELDEFSRMTQKTVRTMQLASNPHGFNIGMNQGEVAGAGVSAHLHQHIIPRWQGDANFFPIIGRTKAMPLLLSDALKQYRNAWNKVN
jgi:ATP adenylyltransferase